MKKGDRYNYKNYNRDNYRELQQKIESYSKDITPVDLWKISRSYPVREGERGGKMQVVRVRVTNKKSFIADVVQISVWYINVKGS